MAKRRPLRTLLLAIFATAALYAAFYCLLRAPAIGTGVESTPAASIPNLPSSSTADGEDAQVPDLSAHTARKPNFYTILLSGVDDGNGGSDTNILLAVDAGEQRICGVSIPRDTKALINGKSRKINYAYNYGGISLLASTVSEQLGIPVDFTITVDLRGFSDLVDAVGGVDFDIPIDMDYDDPTQDLSIHFTRGPRRLTGEEALKVVRFRQNNDGSGYGTQDIGRMQTQQAFLKAAADQVLCLSNVDKLGQFVRIFQASVKTDLTLGNLAWLGSEAIAIGPENISFSTLPGSWKSPFVYLDRDAVLELINRSFNPYVEDRLPSDLNIPT